MKIILLAIFFFVSGLFSPVNAAGLFSGEPVVWHEGHGRKQAWLALDQAAVFIKPGFQSADLDDLLARQNLQIDDLAGRQIVVSFAPCQNRAALTRKLLAINNDRAVDQVFPLFYPSQTKRPGGWLILTDRLVVSFAAVIDPGEIIRLEDDYGLERVREFPFGVNTFLYQISGFFSSLEMAMELQEAGLINYAYPDWIRDKSRRDIPGDPLFSDQWHLLNSGQNGAVTGSDINVTPVWDTYRGNGSVIAIVDSGLDLDHEDLTENVVAGLNYDFIDDDYDPIPVCPVDYHGTAAAGVAAARGFNGIGVSGVAPAAGLVGYRLLGGAEHREAEAFTRDNDYIDIYSNSWGPDDEIVTLEGMLELTELVLVQGVENGRNGRGSNFVWANGNGATADEDDWDIWDYSNWDGYANSRYTIAVAASNDLGFRAPYSELGANIFVNAPSSGGINAITSLDRNDSYLSNFGGTSAATPMVSGVIALMLEANPELGWRDVQHILLETAHKNDPGDSSWQQNGAGYDVSYKYGFGRVDAEAAVDAAAAWLSLIDDLIVEEHSQPMLPLVDNSDSVVVDSILVEDDILVDYVEVWFIADHPYWGDLEVILTSPAGTESMLAPGNTSVDETGPGTGYYNWRFGTVRHLREGARGEWQLSVRDAAVGDIGIFNSWRLKVYGFRHGEQFDFGSDQQDDILLRHDERGQLWLYEMAGAEVSGTNNIGGLHPDWDVIGVADFGDDGKADILLRHGDRGQLWLFEMDGNLIQSSNNIGGLHPDWDVMGLADFNGDGKADILLRHHERGQLWLYQMNGSLINRSVNIGGLRTEWDIAGLADFNGDGKADILLRHQDRGQLWCYQMDGEVVALGRNIGGLSTDWQIVGISDFGGDGRADILLRHTGRGQLWLYQMQADEVALSRNIGGLSLDWDIAGVADLSGDGRADILLRHGVRGQLWLYQMKGNVVVDSNNIGGLDPVWQVIAP